MKSYEIDLLCNKKINLSNPIFSQREIEVLAFLCNGRSHKFIASVLGCSVRTVETHARNIVVKSTLPSMEHVINSLTFSGDINILNSVYAYKMYANDFEKFCTNFHVDNANSNVCFTSDDNIDPDIVKKIIEVFEKIGYRNIAKGNDRSCKNIFITSGAINNISPKDCYVLDLEADGFWLGILNCLKAISGDLKIDYEIQKYYSVIDATFDKARSSFIGEKRQDWREKMNKGGMWGIATSACGALVLAGGLYGIFPRQNEPRTITNQTIIAEYGFFFERTQLLKEISNALGDRSSINVVVLVGPGGAGKTTLAENVMKKELENYDIVYKINAENAGDLEHSLLDLADKLATTKELREVFLGIESDSKDARRKRNVVEFIKKQLNAQKRWLLVFDNVEDIELLRAVCPEKGSGNVIITTRNQNVNYNLIFGNKKIINVGELTENEKIGLFRAVLQKLNSKNHYEEADIKRLLDCIPSYPLDVTTVACSIAGLDITIDDYIKNMKIEVGNFDGVDESLMYNSTPYGKTRYGIIVTALNGILDEVHNDKDVKAALLAISMCEAQDIPLTIFRRYKNFALLKNILTLLRKYSFITEDRGGISIHRVVQDMWFKILCKKMSADEIKSFLDTFFSKVVSFEDITYEYRTFKDYSFERRFYASMVGHIKRFADLLKNMPLSEEDKAKYTAKALAIKSVVSLNYNANYTEIARDLNTVLQINEKYGIFGKYDVAILLNRLWEAYSQFDIAGSRDIMQKISALVRNIGDEALPMKIMFKLDKCTDAMMSGNQVTGNRLLQEAFSMLPKNDDYWVRLLNTKLELFINDFNLQSHLNDVALASKTANIFSKLLSDLGAADLKTSIEAAKNDKMPRLVASLMVERIWTYNLAERYDEASEAYKEYVQYLRAYPIAKYELRAQTYNATTLLRMGKLSAAKNVSVTTYKQWKLAGSRGLVFETLADLTEVYVRRGEYEEALKYAADNPGDCGMDGVVQAFADARSFFNYGVAAAKLNKNSEALEFFNNSLKKMKIVTKSCLSSEQFSSLGDSTFEAKNDVIVAFTALKTIFNSLFGAENKFMADYVNTISIGCEEKKGFLDRIWGLLKKFF